MGSLDASKLTEFLIGNVIVFDAVIEQSNIHFNKNDDYKINWINGNFIQVYYDEISTSSESTTPILMVSSLLVSIIIILLFIVFQLNKFRTSPNHFHNLKIRDIPDILVKDMKNNNGVKNNDFHANHGNGSVENIDKLIIDSDIDKNIEVDLHE